MEPYLPPDHNPKPFRNEREYNEWRWMVCPRHLMRRQDDPKRRPWRRITLRLIIRRSEPRVQGPAIKSTET
jgi:hypothetical protein